MKKLVMLAACLLLLTSAASAEAYIGASLGQSDATSAGASAEESSWKLVGGYAFMKFLAVEGSYRDLGSINETVGVTQIGLDASSMDVFGVARLPMGMRFSMFAKAGYAFLDLDATLTDPLLGTITASTSETELAYGAGVSFKVTDSVHIRAEYETFDTFEDMDMMSVGGIFKF
ncbi:MAG: outer membrane beta-barrel protein [Acidobacteriota bacterium]|nr:outer membrane beta-barrel protein [Acidobacteriota bacterium]MDH3784059.1 outer membrane beta-barrel protein [Acidobacteriota bacterium]